MSLFNVIGGIVFGTIVLSIIWFVVFALGREANGDKEHFDFTPVIILSFIVMCVVALTKCAST